MKIEVKLECSDAIKKMVKATLIESESWQELLVRNSGMAKQKIQESIDAYTEAFKALPHAEEYLMEESLSSFMEYAQDKLNDVGHIAKMLGERLDHSDKILAFYDAHLKKEPRLGLHLHQEELNNIINFFERKGYLWSLVESAQAEIRGYKKYFWDPAKKAALAVKVFDSYIDAYIVELRRRVEKQNREKEARW